MKCITHKALIPLLVLSVTSCASVIQDPIDTARYQFDRTLSLDDIAPVMPAYVELPYERCDRQALMSKVAVAAEINSSRDQRVYLLGGEKCVYVR